MDRAAIYYNVGFQLFGSLLPQLADNLVFYYVFRCTDSKLSRWVEVPLFVVVVLTMYFSWTFQYFVFPFFLNTNAQDFAPVAFWTAVVYVISSSIFNLAFSYHFAYLLILDFREQRKMSTANRSFSLNCLIHSVSRYTIYTLTYDIIFTLSTIASGLMNFADQLTNPGMSMIYVIILLLSVHVLFNMKITLQMLKTQVASLSAISNTHYSAKFGLFLKNKSRKIVPDIEASENAYLDADDEPIVAEKPTPCDVDMVEEIPEVQKFVAP